MHCRTGPADKGERAGGTRVPLVGSLVSKWPVAPFSDFTCAHFQETMSLFLFIKKNTALYFHNMMSNRTSKEHMLITIIFCIK